LFPALQFGFAKGISQYDKKGLLWAEMFDRLAAGERPGRLEKQL
jgi:hypothetical protein